MQLPGPGYDAAVPNRISVPARGGAPAARPGGATRRDLRLGVRRDTVAARSLAVTVTAQVRARLLSLLVRRINRGSGSKRLKRISLSPQCKPGVIVVTAFKGGAADSA